MPNLSSLSTDLRTTPSDSSNDNLKRLILTAIVDPESANRFAADPIAAAESIGLSDNEKAALKKVNKDTLVAGFKELNKLFVSANLVEPTAHLSWS